MSWLELKIPPVAYFLLALAGMFAAARWGDPLPKVIIPGVIFAVIASCLAGIMLALPAILAFIKAKTTVHPMNPKEASSLVTGGIYKVTRNPMYVGLALILLGGVLYTGALTSVLLLAAFVVLMTRFQIIPEERALDELFGEAYVAYKARVRRWV